MRHYNKTFFLILAGHKKRTKWIFFSCLPPRERRRYSPLLKCVIISIWQHNTVADCYGTLGHGRGLKNLNKSKNERRKKMMSKKTKLSPFQLCRSRKNNLWQKWLYFFIFFVSRRTPYRTLIRGSRFPRPLLLRFWLLDHRSSFPSFS